jgi:uncharacterized damage-inducible protein DinB
MKKMLTLYADYNAQTNEKVLELLETLPEEKITENSGVYYTSILGILNHLLISDVIWFKFIIEKFSETAHFASAMPQFILTDWKEIIWKTLAEYKPVRLAFDRTIKEIIEAIPENTYETIFNRKNHLGTETRIKAWIAYMHIFNHHTHHRGQIATILDQLNIDNDYSNILWLFLEK